MLHIVWDGGSNIFYFQQMAKMDLSDEDEKVNIETIFWSAMDMLSDDDKKLPQVRLFHIASNII